MTKSDIVHWLAMQRGYRRCLVLRTPLTGQDCAVDPKLFDTYTEIKYRCPGAEGGSQGVTLQPCDIALIDPWHSYDCSMRDLQAVFAALAPGGALVCHDCWPHKEETTHPDGGHRCLEGKEWSGQTYRAWVDFVLGRDDLRYCTVDTDFGCGVAFKEPGLFVCRPLVQPTYQQLAGPQRHLLNLITPKEFPSFVTSRFTATR
jgi:hypothetical protein